MSAFSEDYVSSFSADFFVGVDSTYHSLTSECFGEFLTNVDYFENYETFCDLFRTMLIYNFITLLFMYFKGKHESNVGLLYTLFSYS